MIASIPMQRYPYRVRPRIDKNLKQALSEEPNAQRFSKNKDWLQVKQKLEIAHRIIVGCEPHADLAQEYGISRYVVQAIVKKARAKPKALSELIDAQH